MQSTNRAGLAGMTDDELQRHFDKLEVQMDEPGEDVYDALRDPSRPASGGS